MKVSIGIVTKNRIDIIPKAIQSAQDQDVERKEIVVYDDNSTERIESVVEKFPDVKWYLSKEDKGYLYARNKIMQETTAEYYCSLDDDAWFCSKKDLGRAIIIMDENPNVAAIAFDILSPDNPEYKDERKPFESNTFIGCGHLLRLSAVKEAGYYIPNPGFYGGEERDLSLHLIDLNYKILKLPGVHIWHDKTYTARDLARQHRSGVCNDLVFSLRRTPLLFLIPIFPYKMFNHLKFALRYNKGVFFKPMLKGMGDAFKALVLGKINRKPVRMNSINKQRRLAKNK